jgi:hypothetical protein
MRGGEGRGGKGYFARFSLFLGLLFSMFSHQVLKEFPMMFPIAPHFLCHMLSARGH